MALGQSEDEDPSAEQLAEALQTLLAGARQPAARQRLAAHLCLESAACFSDARRTVVLELLKPALESLGLPLGDEGAERLRHAVHRRIVENDDLQLEALALAARGLLPVAEWPDKELEAEEFLISKLQDTASRCADGELQKDCTELVEREEARGEVPLASLNYLRSLLREGDIPVPAVMSYFVMAKIGLAPALFRSLSECTVPTLQSPPPDIFFQQHVLKHRPAVLQGCFLGAPSLAATCSEDGKAALLELLRVSCGHQRVPVKSYVHQDRSGRSIFAGDPHLRIRLSTFLDEMQAVDGRAGCSETRFPFYLGKVAVGSELAEFATELLGPAGSFLPPPSNPSYGSCFGPLKPEGVFTYLGCGCNTTPVHFDAHENLLVCLCGQKRLWLYPPSDARYLYPVVDFTRSAVPPFAELPEAGYELLAEARPQEVLLHPGDMLYLPACWWHCVEGSQDCNMILSWWFSLHALKRNLSTEDSA